MRRDISNLCERTLVSIGMPVYNGSAYIKTALDSLLNQSYTHFEIIISDNASTDKTSEICEEYANSDNRIKYHRQEFNRGAGNNFGFVLDQAIGEYFMWAAYDDIWSTNFLEESVSHLNQNPNHDFVFPKFRLESIQLKIKKNIGEYIFAFISNQDRVSRVTNFLILHHTSHKCNIVYSLFRRNFIKRVYEFQDISNDGNLGLVILSNGMGFYHTKILFSKRYKKIWPGFLRKFYYLFSSPTSPEFELSKAESRSKLISLYPDLSSQINFVFDNYQNHNFHSSYKVCELESLPN